MQNTVDLQKRYRRMICVHRKALRRELSLPLF